MGRTERTPQAGSEPEPAARLEAAHAAAVDLYGDLGLDAAAYAERARALAKGHFARLGLPDDEEHVSTFLARAALEDVYLAGACEAGSRDAWDVLHARFAARLEGFAVRRGLSSAEAESLVQDLIGDLAAPPPRAAARTLLGTFDGAGSLFGWLSVVLLRRIAGQARRKRPQSLDAQDPQVGEGARAPAGRPMPLPAPAALVGAEDATRLTAAFGRAWARLKPQERLALVLKHRDGRTQREIAACLGVGEARVSRVVSGAVETVATEMRASLGEGTAPQRGVGAWDALALAIGRHLATCGPESIPPGDRHGPSGGPSKPPNPREDA
jgi:RNA polymerase sigma factor (sigma-70 family)